MEKHTFFTFVCVLGWIGCTSAGYNYQKVPGGRFYSCNCNSEGTNGMGNCAQFTGQCPCHRLYTGRRCNQCVPPYHITTYDLCCLNGYHGYYTSYRRLYHHCRYCDCTKPGVRPDNRCDNDGDCRCLPGYHGNKCQHCSTSKGYNRFGTEFCCANGEYFLNNKSCVDCGCHPVGTVTTGRKCDENAICSCRTGFTGDKCDQCIGNFWRDDGVCKALQTYDEKSAGVDSVPFVGKCAVTGHNLRAKSYLHEYDVTSMEECGELCEEYAECIDYVYDYKDSAKRRCLLIGREGFENEYTLGKGLVTGPKECPRSQGCIHVSTFYDSNNLKTITNVESPYKCQELCRSHSYKFFSYSLSYPTSDARTCYLKKDMGTIMKDQDTIGNIAAENFISGSVDCLSCYHFNSWLNVLPYIKTNGQLSISANTYKECQKICETDKRCSFFEFDDKKKLCFKKNERSAAVARPKMNFATRGCNLACGPCDVHGVLNPNNPRCDDAGNCLCRDNYEDKYCKECKDGYSRAADGSCSPISQG